MKKTQKRTKRHYPEDFKQQAINLAKEIGTKEAAEKLGIEKVQTLAAWVREENAEFKELEEARKEIKRLKKELDIEKKSVAILKDAAAFFLSGPPEVKYRGLTLLKEEGHPVKKCCELLRVSPSGFYDWFKRGPSKREQRDGQLKAKIISIFGNSKKTYGSPRIQKSLEASGEKVGKDKVASQQSMNLFHFETPIRMPILNPFFRFMIFIYRSNTFGVLRTLISGRRNLLIFTMRTGFMEASVNPQGHLREIKH